MELVVAHACFGFVKGLTVSLQSRSQDICSAYVEVDSVKTALCEVREDIDTFHTKMVCHCSCFGGDDQCFVTFNSKPFCSTNF